MKIYQEAKVQSDNAKHETRCDEAQREDLHHDLYLNAVKAMDHFDPSRGVKPETFAFAHIRGDRKMAKRTHLRRVNKVGSIETLGHVEVDGEEVPVIETIPDTERAPISFKYETEEMKDLFRFVLKRLAPIERTIIIAMTKCRGNQTQARTLLAAQGIEYKKSTFNEKIVPGLLKKVKGIIF